MVAKTLHGGCAGLNHVGDRVLDPAALRLFLHVSGKQRACPQWLRQNQRIAGLHSPFVENRAFLDQTVAGQAQRDLLAFRGVPSD
jgi:hypothetical protein